MYFDNMTELLLRRIETKFWYLLLKPHENTQLELYRFAKHFKITQLQC